jgi:type IV pilus assembly protein PilM
MDFFYSTYSEEDIKTIYLSGGGANIKEFRQLLASQSSSKVEVMDPFKAFQIKDGQMDMAYIKQMAPQAAICLGTAIRRIGDK